MDVSENSVKANPTSKTKLKKFGCKSALTVTENYVVKKFGPQMPLMVAECLSKSANTKENSSVKFNDTCGWSWLVCGRKLFVWPLSENNSSPDENATIVGKDLMLPPSDLAYNADLAVVFMEESNQFPSCIAVSPEGVIRYWHTLRLHHNWTDVNSQLGGEEVCYLLYVPPLGCLAVTTSASMILIQPKENDIHHNVSITIITDRQNWLGGFGKKMSALLGYMPAPQFLESTAIKCVTRQVSDDTWTVLLLAGHSLQTWSLSTEKYEMLCETNLKPILKNVFYEREEDPISWEIYDMKEGEGDHFLILAGCHNPKMLMILKFSITSLSRSPDLSKSYTLSQEDYDALHCSTLQSLSLIKFLPMSNYSFVFTNKIIISVPMGERCDDVSESIQFHNNYFLGGDFYSGVPVFFSTSHSFVSVTPDSPLEYVDDRVFNIDSDHFKDVMPEQNDKSSYENIIRNAFLQHVKRNITQAKNLINKTFQNEEYVDDSLLATTIVAVSTNIINQKSSKDPRWEQEKGISSFGISSLQLETQLKEKEEVHGFFLLFVNDVTSPEMLGSVTQNGNLVKTVHVLSDHHERIIATRALYRLKSSYPGVIDQAIQTVSEKFPKDLPIKKEEYFFTRSEYIYDGLRALCLLPEKMNLDGTDYETYLKSVLHVNTILIDVITSLVKTSKKKNLITSERKYIPALSLGGLEGLFDPLCDQAKRTRTIGKDYAKALENGYDYLRQLFSLTDIILLTQIDFAPPKVFHELRSSLIEPFVETKLFEEVLMLSEKYNYFPAMIKVCLLTNDLNRLNHYITKYGDSGFCQDLFKFYTDGKMKNQLINLNLPHKYESKLEEFLEDYPSISWTYSVKKQDYKKCYDTLFKLGMRNNDFALRKIRILSLAKLAREVCDVPPQNGSTVDLKLHLLNVQEELPECVLSSISSIRKPVRTFTPEEIFQLFICKQNIEANEHHFKKALELLPLIHDNVKRITLWSQLWQRAVIIDKDNFKDLGPPEEAVDCMLTFKLIQLIILTEDDPQSLIPSFETLTNFELLKDAISNPEFKYLLRYGYEAFCESAGVHKQE